MITKFKKSSVVCPYCGCDAHVIIGDAVDKSDDGMVRSCYGCDESFYMSGREFWEMLRDFKIEGWK